MRKVKTLSPRFTRDGVKYGVLWSVDSHITTRGRGCYLCTEFHHLLFLFLFKKKNSGMWFLYVFFHICPFVSFVGLSRLTHPITIHFGSWKLMTPSLLSVTLLNKHNLSFLSLSLFLPHFFSFFFKKKNHIFFLF